MPVLYARPVAEGDARFIFDWRNDPDSVAVGRSQVGVDWQEHLRWFADQFMRPHVRGLVVECDGEPTMIVWLRRNRRGIWQTSVNSNPATRGRGLSVAMLACALAVVRGDEPDARFSAEIREGNTRSIKLFERNGFVMIYSAAGYGHYVTS